MAFQGRKTAAARCRPGQRPPSGAHPRGLPGHGQPSTGPVPAAHSPASQRLFVQPRSVATGEGCGGTLPPRWTPDTASHARHALAAKPASVVPATEVRTLAGPHTTGARTRPSSGAPGRRKRLCARTRRRCVAPAGTDVRQRPRMGRRGGPRASMWPCCWPCLSGSPSHPLREKSRYRVTWLYRPWPVEEGVRPGFSCKSTLRLYGLARVGKAAQSFHDALHRPVDYTPVPAQ